MKRLMNILLLVTASTMATSALAAEPETLAKLDEALKTVATFEQGGGGSGALVDVERIVFRLPTDDPSREAIEQKLLDTLDAATTADAKRFLCTQLRVIGTDACVPALEKLLTDPDVSHAAVYALGRLESGDGVRALVRGLKATSGKLQVGIVNALANRGICQQTGGEFVKLLGSSDPTVAKAAARALGRIGGRGGIADRALIEARPNAAGPLAMEIDNALLGCAETLIQRNKKTEAATIYETFYEDDQPMQLRCAGLRGLVRTQGLKGIFLLCEAIGSENDELRRSAISLVSLVEGEEAVLAFAGPLELLSAEDQVLLLRALAVRGDLAVSGVIWRMTKSSELPVRVAALEALGKVGGRAVVDLLLQAAVATEGIEQKVARAALVQLGGDGVNAKLVTSLRNLEVCAEAVRALAGRGATETTGDVLRVVENDDASIRLEAISALGILAGPSDLPGMIHLAIEPTQPEDRAVLENALGRAMARIEDRSVRARPVLAALATASAQAKPSLVRLLGKTGSPEALVAIRAALRGSDAAVADAAVAAMAQWPDASVADDLLGVIRTTKVPERKSVALEGFVRLATTAADPTAMYLRVLELVEAAGDRKLVLAGLGQSESSKSPGVLALARRFLGDEQLGPTAGLATLRIANRLKDQDAQLARAALDEVLAKVEHDDVRQRAQEVINDMEMYDDYILEWVGVGPFTDKDATSGEAVYQVIFAPEKPGAEGIEWKPITQGVGSWSIDLEATFGNLDHCAAYLRTEVHSEIDQEVQLEAGTDDACRAWLNGELVYDQYGGGSTTPRQKQVKIKLNKGSNNLVLKLVDHEGGWSFCCRIRKPDGTALEGLKIEAR